MAVAAFTDTQTRQRGDPNTTPGRCPNLDYCSIGMQRVLVHVPIGEPFICPECGNTLRPPKSGNNSRPLVMPALRITVLIIGIGLGGVLGYLIGRGDRIEPKPVPSVSLDAGVKVNTARAMLGLPKLPPGDIAAASAPPLPAPPGPSPHAYPPVQNRPYPSRTVPLDAADPAQHLLNERRFGEVTVDCTLTAGKPACHVGNVRGADAFSAPALDWLKNLAVQYAPAAAGGAASQPDHRWRIIFEDFAGGGAPATPQTRRK